MSVLRLAAAALGLLVVAGCDDGPPPPLTEERARLFLADRTTIRFDGRAPAVTYRSGTGEAFTWRVDAPFTAQSVWSVSDSAGGLQLCHRLRAAPDAEPDARPGCEAWDAAIGRNMIDSLEGDPFDLSSGLAPFRLQQKRYSAVDLLRLTGRGPDDD